MGTQDGVPRSTVAIGTVTSGQDSHLYTRSLLGLYLYDNRFGPRVENYLDELSSANISAARNTVVRRFLKDTEAQWLLFIDSDMEFPPDALEQLVLSAEAHDLRIIGALAYGSDGRLFPTLYKMAMGPGGHPATARVVEFPIDTIIPVDATGCAFLLIHREVLEEMRGKFNPTFPWFQETEMRIADPTDDDPGMQPVGEDITFCLRAKGLGFDTYVDTGVRIGHHKSVVLNHDGWSRQQAGDLRRDGLDTHRPVLSESAFEPVDL